MISWEFLSARRRLHLENFVEGASCLEDALAVFRERGVLPPVDGSLELLFEQVEEEQVEEEEAQVSTPLPPPEVAKPAPRPNYGITPRPTQKNSTGDES